MKIHVSEAELPLELQRLQPVSLYTPERFEALRLVARRFWFTTADNGDGTITIHGPRYFNSSVADGQHVAHGRARVYSQEPIPDLNLSLPLETAYLRLLSEVCCAIAAKSDIFLHVERPLDVPFSDDRAMLVRTSGFFRRLVANYVAVAAE